MAGMAVWAEEGGQGSGGSMPLTWVGGSPAWEGCTPGGVGWGQVGGGEWDGERGYPAMPGIQARLPSSRIQVQGLLGVPCKADKAAGQPASVQLSRQQHRAPATGSASLNTPGRGR